MKHKTITLISDIAKPAQDQWTGSFSQSEMLFVMCPLGVRQHVGNSTHNVVCRNPGEWQRRSGGASYNPQRSQWSLIKTIQSSLSQVKIKTFLIFRFWTGFRCKLKILHLKPEESDTSVLFLWPSGTWVGGLIRSFKWLHKARLLNLFNENTRSCGCFGGFCLFVV